VFILTFVDLSGRFINNSKNNSKKLNKNLKKEAGSEKNI
jgi:hypothetical protein